MMFNTHTHTHRHALIGKKIPYVPALAQRMDKVIAPRGLKNRVTAARAEEDVAFTDLRFTHNIDQSVLV